jgi:HEAT repeat protein
MNTVEQWLKLIRSENRTVRIRAAEGLLNRGDEIPLPVLLSIFDQGLGVSVGKVLKRRRDKELCQEMISRLSSSNHVIREVACEVLGSLGDRAATYHLLGMLNDPYLMVRRAAAFALCSLKDPASVSELKRQYELPKSDLNMELAIGSALRELGIPH